jgi:NADH-quinone oxidoreductase subunit G
MFANVSLEVPTSPEDPDSPLGFSMEGNQGDAPPPLIPFYWAPGWNSVQALTRFQQEAGGPLRGGDPGVRLLEPREAATPGFAAAPRAWEPRDGEWLVVPRHHVFGSDELSLLSPGIARLAPAPYVALGPDDAARLGVRDGEPVDVRLGAETRCLRLALDASLPRGVAALPAGLPDLGALASPRWARITRAARRAA